MVVRESVFFMMTFVNPLWLPCPFMSLIPNSSVQRLRDVWSVTLDIVAFKAQQFFELGYNEKVRILCSRAHS